MPIWNATTAKHFSLLVALSLSAYLSIFYFSLLPNHQQFIQLSPFSFSSQNNGTEQCNQSCPEPRPDRLTIWLKSLPKNAASIYAARNWTYKAKARRHHPRCQSVKGRRIMISYGSNETYVEMGRRHCKSVVEFLGIDLCVVMSNDSLDGRFTAQNNARLLSNQRGGGFWIWKPYIILQFLLRMEDDDVLLYIDGDKTLKASLEDYVCLQQYLKQDVVVFYQSHNEYAWTKADAYFLMNVEHLMPRINETMQIYASYVMLRSTFDSIRFVGEWLTYVQDDRIVTDSRSVYRRDPLKPYYEDNRHDQTVLSLLSKKWGWPSWPNPERGQPRLEKDRFGRYIVPYVQLNLTILPAEFTVPFKHIIKWDGIHRKSEWE